MVSIVGSVLLLLLSTHLNATLSLHITDMGGQQVQEVRVGEPFLVVVVLSEENADHQEPAIKGLQDFSVKRIGYRLATINGKKSLHYTYQVRIDKTGTFIIGPAIDQDTQERSQSMRIKVDLQTHQKPQSQNTTKKNKQQRVEPILLRLWVDRETAYIGQKVHAVLRFYVPEDEQITAEQIMAQEPSTITVSEKIGPKKGVQEIEGKRYAYAEWQWDMFPQEVGKLVIPAYALEYAKHLPMDNYLSGWSAFFGPRYERKRIYSNAVTIDVRALPKTDKQVHAVGYFDHYRITMNPAAAKQYEGIVVTLSVDGVGNMQTLQAPDLLLPDSFKWYASKSYVDELPVGQRKTFEYIVQGMKEGDWEIPEQYFNFFDVDVASYKQLCTAPIYVTILPGDQKTAINQPVAKAVKEKLSKQQDSFMLLLTDYYNERTPGLLPAWLFFLLLLIPAIVYSLYYMGYQSTLFKHHIIARYAQRFAFHTARKQLEDAQSKGDVRIIYTIFMQLFALRMQQPEAVAREDVMRIISASAFASDSKEQFKLFFTIIEEVAYAGLSKTDSKEQLFNEACAWLAQLERII